MGRGDQRAVFGAVVGGAAKVGGKAKVGRTVRAKTGKWTKGTKVRYTWLADGAKIRGEKAAKLKLTRSLRGSKVAVKVVAKKPGYQKAKVVSKAKRVK